MAVRTTVIALTFLASFSSASLAQFGDNQETAPPRVKSPYDPLADVISATIAPSSWDNVGGEGSLQIVEAWGLAVISQTPAAHEEIEKLLATIRRVRVQQDGSQIDVSGFPNSSAVEGLVDSAKRRKIEKILAGSIDLQFANRPLHEVARSLTETHGISFTVDERSLEEIGLDSDVEITVEISDVTLKSALSRMLRDHSLTFIYQDEGLTFTTWEEAETKLITRVYPVRDLAAEPAAAVEVE